MQREKGGRETMNTGGTRRAPQASAFTRIIWRASNTSLGTPHPTPRGSDSVTGGGPRNVLVSQAPSDVATAGRAHV